MKKLIAILFIFISIGLNAQDSIKVTNNGFTIVSIKKTVSDKIAYNRTIEWVNETYKNPDNVITGKVEGKSVTVKGYSSDAWNYKNLSLTYYFSMDYNIYITIQDSLIQFNIVEGNHYNSDGGRYLGNSSSFYKSNGEYRPMYNNAKPSLEATLNNLWFSYQNKFVNVEMSSEEALAELKKAKDKLDLELITQEEYDKLKAELSKYIK